MAEGDLEKGQSSGSVAGPGSAGFEFLIPALIAAICFIGWVCANLQLESSTATAASQAFGLSTNPFNFQITTFAVACTLAWYASSHHQASYALLASIFNWIVVCCWFIYIVPNFGFFLWKSTVYITCFFDNPARPGNYDANVCNSYKASSIFSLFIMIIHFAWFIIYMIKGVSAIKFSAGLKSIFTGLAALNLIGYLLWFAGALRLADKFGTAGAGVSIIPTYIITFMVGACTLLMLATSHQDFGSTTALNLIWHPLTSALLWSNVIALARTTDNKQSPIILGPVGTDDSVKTIAAGVLIMTISETIASILAIIFKFQGHGIQG